MQSLVHTKLHGFSESCATFYLDCCETIEAIWTYSCIHHQRNHTHTHDTVVAFILNCSMKITKHIHQRFFSETVAQQPIDRVAQLLILCGRDIRNCLCLTLSLVNSGINKGCEYCVYIIRSLSVPDVNDKHIRPRRTSFSK